MEQQTAAPRAVQLIERYVAEGTPKFRTAGQHSSLFFLSPFAFRRSIRFSRCLALIVRSVSRTFSLVRSTCLCSLTLSHSCRRTHIYALSAIDPCIVHAALERRFSKPDDAAFLSRVARRWHGAEIADVAPLADVGAGRAAIPRLVVHVGDIAYARGAAFIWEYFVRFVFNLLICLLGGGFFSYSCNKNSFVFLVFFCLKK